jgi:hypothetical protein
MSYDEKCYELAAYFFGVHDPRLQEIAQEIQDTVETFPSEPACQWPLTCFPDCPMCRALNARALLESQKEPLA